MLGFMKESCRMWWNLMSSSLKLRLKHHCVFVALCSCKSRRALINDVWRQSWVSTFHCLTLISCFRRDLEPDSQVKPGDQLNTTWLDGEARWLQWGRCCPWTGCEFRSPPIETPAFPLQGTLCKMSWCGVLLFLRIVAEIRPFVHWPMTGYVLRGNI